MKIKALLILTVVALGSMSSTYASLVYAVGFPPGTPTLQQFDSQTGLAVGAPVTVNYGSTINDIAVDPVTQTLYGLSGANLFTINPTDGSTSTVSVAGMNGSMESLAFDSNGNLYLATQANLYSVGVPTNSASVTLIGQGWGSPYELGSTAQNIRFGANNTLYLTNTAPNAYDTDLYSVNTTTGVATHVGTLPFASLALGNSGTQLLGAYVPAIGNSSGLTPYLVDLGTNPTTSLGPDPDNLSSQTDIVNTTTISSQFPVNVNFSGGADLATAPEPSTLFGVGFLGLMVFFGGIREKLKLPRLSKAV